LGFGRQHLLGVELVFHRFDVPHVSPAGDVVVDELSFREHLPGLLRFVERQRGAERLLKVLVEAADADQRLAEREGSLHVDYHFADLGRDFLLQGLVFRGGLLEAGRRRLCEVCELSDLMARLAATYGLHDLVARVPDLELLHAQVRVERVRYAAGLALHLDLLEDAVSAASLLAQRAASSWTSWGCASAPEISSLAEPLTLRRLPFVLLFAAT
jgi:hypothetical protein